MKFVISKVYCIRKRREKHQIIDLLSSLSSQQGILLVISNGISSFVILYVLHRIFVTRFLGKMTAKLQRSKMILHWFKSIDCYSVFSNRVTHLRPVLPYQELSSHTKSWVTCPSMSCYAHVIFGCLGVSCLATVWFFMTDTKEYLITQLSNDLESSSWSQIKGFSAHFLFEVLVLKAIQMQYLKIDCAIMLAFCLKAAFI